MSTQEATYKRNLESSILFMQHEHAATLKALHEEIQKLQKKCTDLTFELNMAGLDLGRNVPPEVQENIKHLENMIDAQRETQHELEVELDKKDKLIQENTYTCKRQKMKNIEELRMRNQEIEQLRADLDTAANSCAYYQNELLKIKKEKLSNSGVTGHNSLESSVHDPAPPKESRSHLKRYNHVHRTSGDQSRVEVKELPEVRPGSGGTGCVSISESAHSSSPRELIEPFLHHEEQEHEVIQIKQTNPLPPIRTSSGRVVFREPVDVVHVSVHNVPNPFSKSKLSGATTTQEVETLAIGQVLHSEPAWKHQRRKESHSSEYQ